MKSISFVIVVVDPTQNVQYVKSISPTKGTFKPTPNKKIAKTYKTTDAVTKDLDFLSAFVMQGYNFYYEEV